MIFLRKLRCRILGHTLEVVRFREKKTCFRVDEHMSVIEEEHTFLCRRCGNVAYRTSLAEKLVLPYMTSIRSCGVAKWTGLE